MPKINNTKLVFIIILALLYFFSGCRRKVGLPDRHIKREVSSSEIIGTWIANEESLNNIVKEGYRVFNNKEDHILTFMDDNRCMVRTFQSIPPFPETNEGKKLYIHDEEATWHIGKAVSYIRHVRKQVLAVIIKIRSEKSDSDNNIIYIKEKTLTFYIAEDQEGLILWRYVGDPDYSEYFDFIKRIKEG